MKKLSKKCGVQLFVKNTSVVIDTDYLHNEVRNELYGTKNYVMSKIREILVKYHGFTGKPLTDTLDAINKTSRVYKSVGEGVYETVIHAFNPTTKMLYTFKIEYDVERMSNLPSKYKTNNRGENLYKKRLVQLYGGGRLGRYRLALKNVNTNTLLELLLPTINEQLKSGSSVRLLPNCNVEINHPQVFKFTPSDDLSITVKFSSFGSYTRSTVDIIYKGRAVFLLNGCYKEVTEENIKEALAVADQFDEICEIVRNAYSL